LVVRAGRAVGHIYTALVESRGQLPITKLGGEKIYDVDLFSMFHFAFAEVIKMRPPMLELLEVFRDAV
jgi:hypothetical protein